MLNLLLGVIFANFSLAEQNQRYKDLNQNQIEWISIQKKILDVAPLSYNPPKAGLRFRILSLIRDKKFKKIVMLTLSLNIVALGLYHDNENEKFSQSIMFITFYVTFFYLAEFFMKVSCYGVWGYFYTPTFQLEFVILVGYFFDFLLKIYENKLPESEKKWVLTLLTVIKCIKLLSIIRFSGFLKALKSIMRNLAFSMRILIKLFYLILIIFFIYSTIGYYLFRSIRSGVIFNDRINFGNVLSGMMLLFKCMTCDNWVDIMYDVVNGDCEYCGTSTLF